MEAGAGTSESTRARVREPVSGLSPSLLTGKTISEKQILKMSKKIAAIKKQLGQNHKMGFL